MSNGEKAVSVASSVCKIIHEATRDSAHVSSLQSYMPIYGPG